MDWLFGEGIDVVIVELGVNDVFRGILFDIMCKNIMVIVSILCDCGIEVLVVGMLVFWNFGEEYVKVFDLIYKDVVFVYDVVFYLFFFEGVVFNFDFNFVDGIYFNVEGVVVMVENIFLKVEELFVWV